MALLETKVAREERDARIMLNSHQLMKAGNYKEEIVGGARGVWTTSMAILDTGAGPNLVEEEYVMAAWKPLMKVVKAIRLRLA